MKNVKRKDTYLMETAKKDKKLEACGLMDVKCHTCGKVFSIWPQLYAYYRHKGYKGRKIWFCKYSCMTEYDRKVEEKAKRKTLDSAKSNV